MRQDDLKNIIAEVLKEFKLEDLTETSAIASSRDSSVPTGSGIYSDLDTAIRTAREAQLVLVELGLDRRREIIAAMRQAFTDNARLIAETAAAETGMGNADDKTVKNLLAAAKTPGVEDVEPSVFTDEHGLTLVERAPYGVIGAIIPSTNPTATVISNGIGMVAAGNTVVFNPHPSARGSSCLAISITGGPGVVRAAMRSDKKVIAAGPGNPPCVVDETADIAKAGRDIVNGAGFDHNIICICEKEVIVVETVADELKKAMCSAGAYELTGDEIRKVTELTIKEPGGPGKDGAANKKYVGKSPVLIASDIGLSVPDGTKILLCEVDPDHPLLWTEQLMPVIPLVRVKDAQTAIRLGFDLEHGYRHTAVMHSRNIDNLSEMARLMNCSLFVKNGPSYAGLGQGGAGFTSFTIASPTGEGLTRARTFTRERRCTLVDRFRIV